MIRDRIGHRPSRLSLRAILSVAAALLTVACAAILLLTLSRMTHAAYFLERASRSYDQLALVSHLEADVQALLLDAGVRSHLPSAAHAGVDLAYTGRAQDIERTLAQYLATIQGERQLMRDNGDVESAGAAEYDEAVALRQVFRKLLGDLGNEDVGAGPGEAAPESVGPSARIAESVGELRARVHAIVERERAEVAEVSAAMAAMRRSFMTFAGLMAAATVVGVVSLLVHFSRAVIEPIASLRSSAERIGHGNLDARVEPHGARDVVELGRKFNEMAARLAHQQRQLMTSNEKLEHAVQERTHELQAKSEQLAQIDRSRRLFFAKIGHELRTPVTVLRGEAEVALRDRRADVPSLQEALQHIVASGDALQRRLEDLLALARSDDGRISLVRQPIDLAACMRRAAAQATAYAAASGVRLELDGVEVPCTGNGDESWLMQALLALIDNAVKFSPADATVTVRLRLSISVSSCEIEVSDQGPGVPDEVLDRLFDPYFQAEGGSRRGGSGLGLAVARWVAEQHQGRIAASNRAAGGFAVTMTIPRGDVAS